MYICIHTWIDGCMYLNKKVLTFLRMNYQINFIPTKLDENKYYNKRKEKNEN